jgi:hypothetical protein
MMKCEVREASFHHSARIHGDIAVRYRVREGLDPDAEFWVRSAGAAPRLRAPSRPLCHAGFNK